MTEVVEDEMSDTENTATSLGSPPEAEQPQSDSSLAAGADVMRYGEGYRFQQYGWIYLHVVGSASILVEGDPHDRGFQHRY